MWVLAKLPQTNLFMYNDFRDIHLTLIQAKQKFNRMLHKWWQGAAADIFWFAIWSTIWFRLINLIMLGTTDLIVWACNPQSQLMRTSKSVCVCACVHDGNYFAPTPRYCEEAPVECCYSLSITSTDETKIKLTPSCSLFSNHLREKTWEGDYTGQRERVKKNNKNIVIMSCTKHPCNFGNQGLVFVLKRSSMFIGVWVQKQEHRRQNLLNYLTLAALGLARRHYGHKHTHTHTLGKTKIY